MSEDNSDYFAQRDAAAALKLQFEKRVARVAQRLGLPVKSWSLPFIAGLVRKDGVDIPDDLIAKRIEGLVPVEKKHFDLGFDPNRAGNTPDAKLEHARRVEAALQPKQPPQRMRLTEKERAWVAKHGPQAALEIANRAQNGEPPLFEDESNVDE